MRSTILIITLLVMPLIITSGVEVNQMAYTKISNIQIDYPREVLGEAGCLSYGMVSEQCRIISFDVEFQIWNPEETPITFTTDTSQMVDLNTLVEINEDVDVIMVDSTVYEQEQTTHTINPGVTTQYLTLSVISGDDRYNLADGLYTMNVVLKTQTVGQIAYLGQIKVEQGIRTYSLEDPTGWPATVQQESFNFMILLVPFLILVAINVYVLYDYRKGYVSPLSNTPLTA